MDLMWILWLFLAVCAVMAIFWLIGNKFPEPLKTPANVVVALFCIILLLYFLFNVASFHAQGPLFR